MTQSMVLPLENPMNSVAGTAKTPNYNVMTWYSAKENQSAHDSIDGIENGPFAMMLAKQLDGHKTIRQLAGEVSASMFEFLQNTPYRQQTPFLDVGEGAKRFRYRDAGRLIDLSAFAPNVQAPIMQASPSAASLNLSCLSVVGVKGCLTTIPLTDKAITLRVDTKQATVGALVWATLKPAVHDLEHFVEPVSAYCTVDAQGECLLTLHSDIVFDTGPFVVDAQLYAEGQAIAQTQQQYLVTNPRR